MVMTTPLSMMLKRFRQVFLDTSGLFCYQSVSEPECKLATRLFETPRPKLTHSYVLSEYLALVTARRLNRAVALDFLSDFSFR